MMTQAARPSTSAVPATETRPRAEAAHAEPAREHNEIAGVAVLLGAAITSAPGTQATEVWPTADMLPAYGYEGLYYPERISRADAETAIRAELADKGVVVVRFLDEDDTWSTDVEDTRRRMLGQWGEFRQIARDRGTTTARAENFMNEIDLLISVSPDPQGTLAAVIELLAGERVKNRACRSYAWCSQTGPHYDHSRHENGIVSYGATHLSEGTPSLYVGMDEFPPEQAAAKAAQLRAIADRIEAMAAATQAGT
ncbi:hypothetical protein [Streptomyces sp. NPDC058108]|uniref:hypothetical protein n=1 Tax=Streptomyces sp. NPDC058108 TaxID=3346344 RepID=UPI0036ECD138